MYGKLKITADIEVLTGMHIGGSNAFSGIGAVTSPVIKDAKTRLPIIPGSSLKGKLRTLMARSQNNSYELEKAENDPSAVARLFGTMEAPKGKQRPLPSRLQFCDCFLKNTDELLKVGPTEIKSENTIDRMTSIAKPRQIERVIRGSVFGLNLIYDIINEKEIPDDFKHLAEGIKLLQMDYLGGHGTRGYGRVSFKNFAVEAVEDCLGAEKVGEIVKILKEAEKSGLQPV